MLPHWPLPVKERASLSWTAEARIAETVRLIEQAGRKAQAVRCDVTQEQEFRTRSIKRSALSVGWTSRSITPASRKKMQILLPNNRRIVAR